ncbi:kelch domain-containing protein 10 homolog [Adelges cooleyi]|uniref:kelch domain-containing protein 10 homolog n=1 Tax=Adelges cooleyi TaxID=133065 RepID=UPI0021806142|nr:kelch domain-containing protein 10 homolog [Adelges cooleyi]
MSQTEYTFKPLVFEKQKSVSNDIPDLPHTRIDHGIACNDEYLYYYRYCSYEAPGLEGDLLPNKGCLWKFNLVTCQWKNLRSRHLSRVLSYSSIILSGNLIIIYGGTGVRFSNYCPYNIYIGNLLGEYTEEGIVFEEINCTNGIPRIGYGQSIVLNGRYIYTVNGLSGFQREADVYRFDISTKKWEILSDGKGILQDFEEKYKYELAYYNQCIFTFGGSNVHINSTTNFLNTFMTVHVFDLTTKTWRYLDTKPDQQSTTPGYPENRINHGWVQCPTHTQNVYLLGGYDKFNFMKDVWCFNLSTFQWRNLSMCSIPKPTFFLSAAMSRYGHLYYYNGLVSLRCLSTRRLEPQNHVYTTWVRVPQLKEMCWDAILFYFRKNLLKLNEEDLRKLGLPLEYYKLIIKAKEFIISAKAQHLSSD